MKDGSFGDAVSGHVQPGLQLLGTSQRGTAKNKAEEVVTTMRKRAREVETVPWQLQPYTLDFSFRNKY